MTALRLLYVNFETLDPDRAIHTHVYGLVEALRRQGWQIDLIAEASRRSRGLGLVRQFWRYARLNLRAFAALRSCDGVYMRAHFAGYPLAVVAKWANVPVFQEVNGVPDEITVTYPGMRRFLPLFRALYRRQFVSASHLFAGPDVRFAVQMDQPIASYRDRTASPDS